jgi:DNA-directed RNA polymerase III subunit RPC3
VVLIQQHLALHYTSEIDGITYYEANWQHAYDLVRSGKIIKFVEDRFGEKAGGIISNLLLLGHTKVSDLSDAYGVTNKKANSDAELKYDGDALTNEDGLANGVDEAHDVSKTESHIDSRGQLYSILHQLLHSGWIVPVQELHFWPSAEHHNEAEVFVISTHFEGKVPKGPKKVPDFARLLKERKRKNRDESLEIPQMNGIASSKRYGSSAVQPSKRVKLSDAGSDHLQNDVWLDVWCLVLPGSTLTDT